MKNNKSFKSIKNYITEIKSNIIGKFGSKTLFFVIAFIICILFLATIKTFMPIKEGSYFDNLTVEIGGFLFDILLFGVVLGFYEFNKSKKEKIKHYKEEIEDYRGWKEKEASYRIFGNIKRLNQLGVSQYDLNNCYFDDIEFRYKNTFGIDFKNSNICGATFKNSILKYANLSLIKDCRPKDVFEYYFINVTTFDSCVMKYAHFGSITYGYFLFKNIINMQKVEFNGSVLENCSFENVNFLECLFNGVIFKNCTFITSNVEIAKFVDCTYLVTANMDNLLSEELVSGISGLTYKRK